MSEIDVSKCKFYLGGDCTLIDNCLGAKYPFLDKTNPYCSCYDDCYYKQLQELKQQLQLERDNVAELNELLISYKEENERLQEEIGKYRREMCNDCGERDDYDIPCKQIRDLDYGLCITVTERDELQQKLEKIKEFINDYGAMQSDADCGLPIGILQIIEGE